MSLPGFTAGKSVYRTLGVYRMGGAVQAPGLVRPAAGEPISCCTRCLTECSDSPESCLRECSSRCGLPCGPSNCGPCQCRFECSQQCCDNVGHCQSQGCGLPFRL
jgi:hypothetical protein